MVLRDVLGLLCGDFPRWRILYGPRNAGNADSFILTYFSAISTHF